MKKLLVIAFIVLLAVVLSGCKTVEEKAAEKIIETSSGGAADVDIDNDTVTLNVNGGSLQVGESVSLPSGFPSDVHVVDGTIVSAVNLTEGDGYMVNVRTSKSVDKVKTEYETELDNDGWSVTASLTMATGVTITAEKGNRTMTVSVSDDDGTTAVVVSTSTLEE